MAYWLAARRQSFCRIARILRISPCIPAFGPDFRVVTGVCQCMAGCPDGIAFIAVDAFRRVVARRPAGGARAGVGCRYACFPRNAPLFYGLIGDFRVVTGLPVSIKPVRTGQCPDLLYMVYSGAQARGRSGRGVVWCRCGETLRAVVRHGGTPLGRWHGTGAWVSCRENASSGQKAAKFIARGVRTA
jgi:hypothetical protein